jgi:hypothetical protein
VKAMPQATQPEQEPEIEITTGMSAPPIDTIKRQPSASEPNKASQNATRVSEARKKGSLVSEIVY